MASIVELQARERSRITSLRRAIAILFVVLSLAGATIIYGIWIYVVGDPLIRAALSALVLANLAATVIIYVSWRVNERTSDAIFETAIDYIERQTYENWMNLEHSELKLDSAKKQLKTARQKISKLQSEKSLINKVSQQDKNIAGTNADD